MISSWQLSALHLGDFVRTRVFSWLTTLLVAQKSMTMKVPNQLAQYHVTVSWWFHKTAIFSYSEQYTTPLLFQNFWDPNYALNNYDIVCTHVQLFWWSMLLTDAPLCFEHLDCIFICIFVSPQKEPVYCGVSCQVHVYMYCILPCGLLKWTLTQSLSNET